jgi:WD40 repeat protein
VVILAFSTAWPCAAAEPPDYSAVAGVFKKYCNGCHNSEDLEGGLVLESFESLSKGGDKGAAVVPGNVEASLLLRVLTGKAEPAMPPEGNPGPKPKEIALIEAWIAAGAKGPEGAVPDPTILVTPKIEVTAPAKREITAAAWSPDGKRIALARYGEVELLDAAERTSVAKLAGHRGQVNALAFSSDGELLAAAGGEPGLFGEVRIWKVADGSLVRTITGHRDAIYALAVQPKGTLLATGGYDQQIKLWDLASGAEVRTLEGHSGAVFDLAYHPSGKILASASADRTVKLWDVATGSRLDTFGQPLKEVNAVALSPDGRHVAAGGADNRIRLWRLSDDAREGTNPLLVSRFAHEGPIVRLAWSPDGRTIASAAEDGTLKFWEAEGLVERAVAERQPDWALALTFAPDSRSLAAGRFDGSLAFYNPATARPVPPQPELGSLSRRGVERGKPTQLEARGKHLVGAIAAQSDEPKLAIRVVKTDEADGTVATLELAPAADLARGKYHVWLAHEGLETSKLPVYVDDLPQAEESEPNATLAQASELPSLPASAWGVLSAQGDVDHFRFAGRRGQTLVFDVSAAAIGSKANCVLTIFDPDGRSVAGNNDFDGQGDPLVAYTLPADGEYRVQVTDLQRAGSEEHFYRLSLGEFPFVTSVYPLGVPAGAETEVELVGYNLPPGAKATVAASQPGEVAVALDAQQYRFRAAPKVAVSDRPRFVEREPNDVADQAQAIETPAVVEGRISSQSGGKEQSDTDLFRFQAKAGETWILETEAARRGSPIDTVLEVLDTSGRPVPRLLLQAVRDSSTTFRGSTSDQTGFRVTNWEEMDLEQYLYLRGEVCRIFRQPQGPDSDTLFYSLAGKRRGYFDTTPMAHALDEPVYVVQPHALGTRLAPNGLPVFTLPFANDDDSYRERGSDSRLTFTAPSDGEYVVRVADVRGFSGPRHAYRLILRRPEPDFEVRIAAADWNIPAGSGKRFTVEAERRDEFDGDIRVDVSGLPPGFGVSTPLVVQAGHLEAQGVIWAQPDAQPPSDAQLAAIEINATADVGGSKVAKHVPGVGKLTVAAAPKLTVSLEPAELTIAPGTTITAQLRVVRSGFDDRITFNVGNLPHGVIVDNIGLNGVLIPEGQTERTIYLTAGSWVPETSRTFQATAEAEGNQTSQPVMLHVRRGAAVAQAESKER